MSAESNAIHAALAWHAQLTIPHALAWLSSEREGDLLHRVLSELFADLGFPVHGDADDLLWRHDPLGKPFVEWRGESGAWAARTGRDGRHLHVSNTHDGGVSLVFAAYAPHLVGVGIDMVYLPRLRRPGRDARYLRRFAAQFMSAREWRCFADSSAQDDEEQLRLRVAAHFSLMEAASKACGTGLRMGGGIGRTTALPKQSLGVCRITPPVALLFEGEALDCLQTLGATRWEGHWAASHAYLVSAVLLTKNVARSEGHNVPR